MKCPACHEDNDRVIDSRASHDGFAIRRRRVCAACGHRYTTYERIESAIVKLIKKDGTRQAFDPHENQARIGTRLLEAADQRCPARSDRERGPERTGRPP